MHAQSQSWDPSRQCMAWHGFNWRTSYAIPLLWAHLRDVCWWHRLVCASEVQRTLVYITLQLPYGTPQQQQKCIILWLFFQGQTDILKMKFSKVFMLLLFLYKMIVQKMTYTLHHFYDHKTKKMPTNKNLVLDARYIIKFETLTTQLKKTQLNLKMFRFIFR